MLAKIYSAGLFGIDGFPVLVEVDAQNKLDYFEVVGALPHSLFSLIDYRAQSVYLLQCLCHSVCWLPLLFSFFLALHLASV